ncbi:hypothetical protein Gotur_032065 [Gossypium turneri]
MYGMDMILCLKSSILQDNKFMNCMFVMVEYRREIIDGSGPYGGDTLFEHEGRNGEIELWALRRGHFDVRASRLNVKRNGIDLSYEATPKRYLWEALYGVVIMRLESEKLGIQSAGKMEISIKESTIVCPAEGTPKRSLWNSNLDIVMAKYHLPTIYYYKPNGSSDFFDTGRLKEALSKILVPFYPIAGRLGYDENGRLEIICNAEGSIKSTILEEYLLINFLYCRVQHTLGDGIAALHSINSWADTSWGLSPAIAPFIDRILFRARDPPTPKFHRVEDDPSPVLNVINLNEKLRVM